jgi:hypothetical protein
LMKEARAPQNNKRSKNGRKVGWTSYDRPPNDHWEIIRPNIPAK